MKKYRAVLDVILLGGLIIMSMLALAPKTFVMPTSIQMILLAAVLALLATFLVLLWREHPSDEREAENQAVSSRLAYIVGAVILIISMVYLGLKHQLDPVEPITLFAMIATKIIVQRNRDGS